MGHRSKKTKTFERWLIAVLILGMALGPFSFEPQLLFLSPRTPQAQAAGTINIVHQTNASNTAGSSLTFAVSSTAAGNALILGIELDTAGMNVTSITDNGSGGGSTYQSANTRATLTGNGHVDIWYTTSTKAGVTSTTINMDAAQAFSVWAYEVSGLLGANIIDATGTINDATASTTPKGVNLTTNSSTDFIVQTIFDFGQVTGIHAGNAYTYDGTQHGDGSAHLITSAAGSYQAQWDSNNNTYAVSAVAFRGAPASPPRRPILASPAPSATAVPASGPFIMSATASSSYVQFVQTIYQNEAGTQVVQTNSQTSTQTGWSGQDASSSKAYVSGSVTGTAATFSAPSGLASSTTYYWGAQTIDPNGGGGSSTSSLTIVDSAWNTSPNQMPLAQYFLSAVTSNGYIYLVGGSAATSSTLYAPINSDGSPGVWKVSSNQFPAVYQNSAVAYKGYIYSTGGLAATITSTVSYAPINADGSPGVWSTSPNKLPTPDQNLSAVAYNGYIYVTGGNISGTVTSSVFYAPINADGSPGVWTTSPNKLPNAIYSHSAVAYNGYIYVTGGNDGSLSTSSVFYAPINADGSPGAWNTSPNHMPSVLQNHAAIVSNDYIYVTGGSPTTSAPTSSVFYAPINADGSPGVWNTSPNKLPINDYQHAAVASNGYIYITGGKVGAGAGTATSTVFYAQINEKGRIADEGWRTNTALPSAVFGHSAAAYNGYLYITGGCTAWSAVCSTDTSTVRYAPISANGTIGSWTNTTALPGAVSQHRAFAYNGHLYILGGYVVAGSNPTSSVQYATINSDGTIGNWITTTAMPNRLNRHAAAIYNGYLYEIGGHVNTGATTSSVSYAPINSDGSVGSWVNTTSFPTPILSASAVASNGYLYVTGGNNGSDAVFGTSTVSYAPINPNGSVGTWANTAALPAAVYYHSSVLYNGYLYSLGGCSSTDRCGSNPVSTVYYSPILPLTVGSGTIGSWLGATSMPSVNAENSAVAYNGYLYVSGGCISSNCSTNTSTVLSAPLYTSLTPFTTGSSQTPRRPILNGPAPNATTTQSGIVFSTTATHPDAQNLQYKVQIYQNEAGTQVVETDDQTASQTGWSGQNASSGKEYASGQTGTFTTTSTLNASTTYWWGASAIDPEGSNSFGKNSLTIKDPTWANTTAMPAIYRRSGSAVYNGYVYIVGGEAGSPTIDTSTVRYAPLNSDGTVGAWSSGTSLSTTTTGLASVAFNGYLYAIGGNLWSSRTSSVFYTPISSNGSIGAWTSTTAFPSGTGTSNHSAVVYNGKLYVIGGYSGVSTSSVFYATINSNGTLGAWTAASSLPAGLSLLSAAAYNGYLYVVGGQALAAESATNTVKYAAINSDGSLGTWTTTTGISTGTQALATVAYNGYLYETGGYPGVARPEQPLP